MYNFSQVVQDLNVGSKTETEDLTEFVSEANDIIDALMTVPEYGLVVRDLVSKRSRALDILQLREVLAPKPVGLQYVMVVGEDYSKRTLTYSWRGSEPLKVGDHVIAPAPDWMTWASGYRAVVQYADGVEPIFTTRDIMRKV